MSIDVGVVMIARQPYQVPLRTLSVHSVFQISAVLSKLFSTNAFGATLCKLTRTRINAFM